MSTKEISQGGAVITVEHLSKKYLIGHERINRARPESFRELISQNAKRLGRTALEMARGQQIVQGDEVEDFWALNDVSFEVRRGEVMGIIGRNGAGKSTLLKILSRITEPTSGRITIRGRVASLLEVGTGFHPELTGRENVFLNGAILGMTRWEIKAKFDEIVDFAEIERFLDTPVKRYSSGMYVRLAFAVAAHLEPEILIVDEVLSVGDAKFQQKCMGTMDGIAKGGRTVLLVSHDMRKVAALCDQGILLNGGIIQLQGCISAVVDAYSQRVIPAVQVDLSQRKDRSGSGEIQCQSIELLCKGQSRQTFYFKEQLSLKIRVKVNLRVGAALIGLSIVSSDGIPVHRFASNDEQSDWFGADVGEGEYEIIVTIDQVLLYPGVYSVDVWIGDSNLHRIDLVSDAIQFTISQGSGKLSRALDRAEGLVYQRATWTQKKIMELNVNDSHK